MDILNGSMKKLPILFIFALIIFMIPVTVSAGSIPSRALPPPLNPNCLMSDVVATYSYSAIGQAGVAPPFTPFSALANVTLDQRGNINGSGFSTAAGKASPITIAGTYTVNLDCSATFSFSVFDNQGNLLDTITLYGVVTSNGAIIHAVVTSNMSGIQTGTVTLERVLNPTVTPEIVTRYFGLLG